MGLSSGIYRHDLQNLVEVHQMEGKKPKLFTEVGDEAAYLVLSAYKKAVALPKSYVELS